MSIPDNEEILAGGRWETRNGFHKYTRNYDFSYKLPPPLGPARGDCMFTVTSVLGHLTSSDFDDDHRRWTSCDPFALFDAPIVTTIEGDMKKIERNLQAEARHANLLMIWTDCDREGEHIGSEIVATCRKVNANLVVKRARFSAIIAAQIHQACCSANDLDMRQADAVEARIALDLRIGAAFTRYMTQSLQNRVSDLSDKIISYGPCQFPTLGFVVDQYNRVQSFVPEPFWSIDVSSQRESDDQGGNRINIHFTWRRGHIFDQTVAMLLFEECVEHPMATVTKVETKPTSRWKPLPLTTVQLQQSGSRLLHMTPKRVLDLAEKLYQKGFLSYPRTETDQFDKDFDFDSLIRKQTYDNTWGAYAQKLLDGAFQRPRNGKKNDKAHPPIHPTNSANNLDTDERRVYELVTRRFLASCSSNAEGSQTNVEIKIAGEFFSTSGLVILKRNYLEIYQYDTWSSNPLPNFQEQEQFLPSTCELKEGATSRPNLLTEADLVGLMDRNGIGTDATIAEHIAKIIDREYVHAKKEASTQYLIPSTLGIGLVEGYNAIGFDRSLSKPHLRRETEHRMQLICDGQQLKNEVLDMSINEYKEVFIKAKREFNTIIDSVVNYLHGDGDAQEALRAAARANRTARGARGARGLRGGRGGRGGGSGPLGRPWDDSIDDDDDDDDGPGGQGGTARGGKTESRRGIRSATTRGRAGRIANMEEARVPSRKRKNESGESPRIVRDCKCGDAALLRTAGPSSSNAGRPYFTCAKPQDSKCEYFEWADAVASDRTQSRQVAPPKRPRSTLVSQNDDSNVIRCNCGLEATSGTTTKEGPNKGKRFWACPNNPKARCGFFTWCNEDKQNDHYKRFGDGGGSGDCFKCGQPGHWSNVCPNDGGRDGTSDKSTRGGPLRSIESGQAMSRRGQSAASKDTDVCYKCGEGGHWANACPHDAGPSRLPNARGTRGRAGTGTGEQRAGSSGVCFKCGEPGHWSNACPNDG